MSKLEKAEPFYQKRAQELVDMLYDNRMLNPELKRQDFRAIEDYVAYMYQSQAESGIRIHNLMKSAPVEASSGKV